MSFFPDPFNGLGVHVSYSYTQSNGQVTEDYNSGTHGVEGLSRNVGNFTVYYDKAQSMRPKAQNAQPI
jgi:hypothetical protein